MQSFHMKEIRMSLFNRPSPEMTQKKCSTQLYWTNIVIALTLKLLDTTTDPKYTGSMIQCNEQSLVDSVNQDQTSQNMQSVPKWVIHLL